jgi:hypothetical protein
MNLFKPACQGNGPHPFMYSLKKLLKLSTKVAVVVMFLNVQLVRYASCILIY